MKSTAHRFHIVTGEVTPQSTRYPDGANSMNQMSVYATHTHQLNDKWTLNDGIRVGGSWLHSAFLDKSFFPFPFDEMNQNYVVSSANVGIIYTPSSWKFSFMGSSGYRAPNIDDITKVFDSSPGNVVVPNPGLTSEKTINGDLNMTKLFGSHTGSRAVAPGAF